MPFSGDKHYTMRGKRNCNTCHRVTDQMCVSVRYGMWPEPTVPASYEKRMKWICEACDNLEEEVKQVFEPTDHFRII